VLCVDEKTRLQPRTRLAPTLPAQPGLPVRVEHEYERKGALNLFAASDTRTGKVYGQCHERKRQVEFIQFLEHLNREISAHVTLIHLVMDNLHVHKGKQVLAWLEKHPRFKFHFTPVHCSWMNQVEQWFGILQRKRFGKPFNWTRRSFDKVLAKAEQQTLEAAAEPSSPQTQNVSEEVARKRIQEQSQASKLSAWSKKFIEDLIIEREYNSKPAKKETVA